MQDENLIKRKLFDRAYAFLNDKQRQAVFTTEGPLLVLAGAGSGKTTVLVHRIAFVARYGNAYFARHDLALSPGEEAMLAEMANAPELPPKTVLEPILACFAKDPCPPENILAITFTNKAAGEIKERLQTVLGDKASDIWAGTFHSVCVRLLRRFAAHTRFSSDFIIYDQDDCKKLFAAILKDKEIENPEITPKTVANVISRAKNALLGPDDFAEKYSGSEKYRVFGEIYQAYQKTLEQYNALDFDDLIAETVRLLQTDADVLAWCQKKFRYVFVDEYQDTNHAQYLLMKLIGEGSGNVMVVGDDDQSIYKFRGAAVENILSFDKCFPNTKTILLEQNYRSTKNILDAANALIAHNDSRHGKTLWCQAPGGKKVALRQLADQEKEAVFIADRIAFFAMQKLYSYKDIAVLYRTKAQSNILETVFTKSGIPHRLLAGMRFYEHAEIKDLIAYLRFIENGNDFLSFSRIINSPRRGIGQATVEKIAAVAARDGISVVKALEKAATEPTLKRAAEKLTEFARLIASLADYAKDHLPSETVRQTIDRSEYLLTLLGDENEEKRKNVDELISSAKYYEERNEDPTLAGFLEEIALVSDVDNYDESANSVVLMTVHAAKGLEFPVVFLCGMEENLFPSPRSANTEEDLEEERRLAYVAMTRAKKELFITCAAERMLYGKTDRNPISRFVREIPKELLDIQLAEPKERRSYGYRENDFFLPKREFAAFEKRTAIPFSAAPVKKTAPPRSAPIRFHDGDRVNHAIFGAGTVLSSKAYGSDTMYEIAFDQAGTKKLMATYAKLSKL